VLQHFPTSKVAIALAYPPTGKEFEHMDLSITFCRLSGISLAFLLLTASGTAMAESGLYIGGSAGGATVESDFGGDDTPIPDFPDSFDEDDTAFKVFAGYTFDLPVGDLGIEAAYVDFGEPDVDLLGDELTVGTTALNLWGVATLDAGVIDLFAKVGYVYWDVETDFLGQSADLDGSDIGYGVGIGIGLGPVRVRGEYELYDLDNFDVGMLSAGIEFRF